MFQIHLGAGVATGFGAPDSILGGTGVAPGVVPAPVGTGVACPKRAATASESVALGASFNPRYFFTMGAQLTAFSRKVRERTLDSEPRPPRWPLSTGEAPSVKQKSIFIMK